MTVTLDAMTIPGLDRACAAVRERAVPIDRGETDTREDVRLLGALALLERGLEPSPLTDMITVIESIAAESLSAGFSVWAHRMTLEYVERGPDSVREVFRERLATGRSIGVTAMAAALQQAAGLGDVPLVAIPVDGGIEISGPIRWASNVVDEAIIVLPARGDDGATHIVAIEASAAGVRINPAPQLLALGATASTSLTLERVFVPTGHVISTDLGRFCREIRPTFLALQTSFCAGIAGVSLTESTALLTGLGEQFGDEHAALAGDHASVRARLYELAGHVDEVPIGELIRLRLDASHVAVASTRLEATLRGGAGYAITHPTNRRFREAAFLPIQSPSEGQLRWELTQSR
ncbi:MAG TPA: acyl-CoA dehydrogenase family protein [Aldersonia sp.]